MAISDCNKTEVFRLTGYVGSGGSPATQYEIAHDANASTGNTSGNLSTVFTAENADAARVNQVVAHRYYVAAGSKTRPDGSSINSLYMVNDMDERNELVEGVDDLQILYGEDTSNPRNDRPNRYVDANMVANWDDVVSVRVELTLNPVDIDYTSDNPLSNQIVGTTVNLRNTQR